MPAAKASEVSSVLAEHGYSETSVPKLEGSVDSAIATLEGEIKSLGRREGSAEKKLQT